MWQCLVMLDEACAKSSLGFSAIEFPLGSDSVKRNIPGLCLQLVYTLALVRYAEHEGAGDMFQATGKREAAIVVTTPHADAVTFIVETKQWHNHQIEITCRYQIVTAGKRFRDTEAVEHHSVARLPAAEP